MKTQLVVTKGIPFNHNLSGLKVKPQTTNGIPFNHNLGGLKITR